MHEIADDVVHEQDLHRTKPISIPAWIEEGLTRAPGKRESIFFRVWLLVGCPCSSRWSYTYAYADSAN